MDEYGFKGVTFNVEKRNYGFVVPLRDYFYPLNKEKLIEVLEIKLGETIRLILKEVSEDLIKQAQNHLEEIAREYGIS